MRVGEIISKYLEDNGVSQRDFAKRCGVSNAYISMMIKNENPNTKKPIVPTITSLAAIAKGLNMGIDELIDKADDIQISIPKASVLYSLPRMKRIPVIGEIACGTPTLAEQNISDYAVCPESINADYCLICKGDSMIGARIYNGDIVYIKAQPEIDNGQIAAVLIDNEATLKRVFYYPAQNKLVLNPENPEYEPLVYVGRELEDIKVLGKAVAFTSNIK